MTDTFLITSALLITLACFQVGLWLYEKARRAAWLHPLGTSAALIAIIITLLNIPYRDYLQNNQLISYFLGPSVVALAVPLYREFHNLRKLVWPVLAVTTVGAVTAAGFGWVAAALMGADQMVLLSLAPKAATTPIAIEIASSIGGLTTLTTGAVVFTGVAGALMSPLVFHLCHLRDPRLQGLVLGVNAHGVGTTRSFDISASAGAFSTLAMGLTGSFTALTMPYIVQWLLS